MSELKAHSINDLSLHDIANCDFYLKTEADTVIAELKAEIAELTMPPSSAGLAQVAPLKRKPEAHRL